jgi:hypothetical protein
VSEVMNLRLTQGFGILYRLNSFGFTMILLHGDISGTVSLAASGFGELVVSMLASGTQDRGFEPGRKKIHSLPSFGGEVKPSVPCRKFAASFKEPRDLRGSRNRRPN